MNNLDEQFKIIRQLKNPIDANNQQKNDILKIKIGSFIEHENKLFYIKDKITYEEKKGSKVVDSWSEFELISLQENGAIYFCEIEEDDGLKIYFSGQMIKLRELNIRKGSIKRIIKNEDSVFYKSNEFYYDDDYTAFIQQTNEAVKFVEFEDDYLNYLTVEEYEDGEMRAYASQLVSSVKVVAI
jgi:hypothetical protein